MSRTQLTVGRRVNMFGWELEAGSGRLRKPLDDSGSSRTRRLVAHEIDPSHTRRTKTRNSSLVARKECLLEPLSAPYRNRALWRRALTPRAPALAFGEKAHDLAFVSLLLEDRAGRLMMKKRKRLVNLLITHKFRSHKELEFNVCET